MKLGSGWQAFPSYEALKAEGENTGQPVTNTQNQGIVTPANNQESGLHLSTTRSKTSTGPLPFLDAAHIARSFPITQWLKTLPAQQINHLISSLKQDPDSLSAEQLEQLTALEIHALSASERSLLADELRVENALQVIRGGNAKSPSITLRVIQQLQQLAQQENLSPENYQKAYPMPFIKVAGLEALTNPDLLPLLPQLAEEAEALKQYLKPVPIEVEKSSYRNISDQIHAHIGQANQLSQTMGEDISLELESLQDRIDAQEMRQQSLELESDGVGLYLDLAQKRLVATEAELTQTDLAPMKRAELQLDKIRYTQQIQKFAKQQSELQAESQVLNTEFETVQAQLKHNVERIDVSQNISNYQALSQEQRNALGLQETALAEMGRVMQEHAAGFTQHIEKLLQPGEVDADLNLEQDLNFTFSQIFDPNNWGHLNAFHSALQGGVGSLSDSEKEALKHFGLYTHQGKLINLVNRQPLTEQQRSALQDTCAQYQCSRNVYQVNASSVTAQLLEKASTNLIGVQAIRERVSQWADELELATKRVEASNSQIEALLQEAAELGNAVQTFEARLENVTDIVAQLRQLRDERGLKDYLRQLAASGQLEGLKTELSEFLGVDFEVNGSQVRFAYNGNTMSPEAFVRILEVRLRLKNHELQNMQTALTETHAKIETARQQLHSDQSYLRSTRSQSQEAAQDYRVALAESRMDLQELLSLRQDPARWNQLDQYKQQEILAKIAELQAEHAQAPAVFERLEQLFERSNLALERAEENLALAAHVLNQLEDLLFALEGLSGQILQLLEGVETLLPHDEIDILGHALLNGLPKQAPQELEQSMSAWLETLREGYARADRLLAQEAAEAEISAHFDRQQIALKQQALKHHIQQLEALDERGRTITQEQLESSLRHYLNP